jgi:pimeloyl-ACP methyl ester carboxylesterase
MVAKQAEALGLRLVCFDRPGTGLSDPKKGYRLLDWPSDVVEAADQLGIRRFVVEGLSGGGPYALACAYRIPEQLSSCALISPYTGPFMSKAASRELRAGTWLVVHLPWLAQGMERLSNRLEGTDESGEKKLIKKAKWLGGPDERLLSNNEVRRAVVRAFEEGSRQESNADAKDASVFAGPWGFRVEEIALDNIFLFQGEKDHVLPAADARRLAQAIPHCRATFYPDDAHLSTFVNHAEEIWKAVMGS